MEQSARSSRVNLAKVAEIAFLRKTGMLLQKQASLANGQKMEIVLPETVSNFVYLDRNFEPEVSTALEQLIEPGMCLWNIGAHIGLRLKQTHQTLGPRGFIYAFEPTTRTRKFLEKYNARDLSCRVSVQPFALSNFDGYTPLTDFGWRLSGSNTIEAKPRMSGRNRSWLTRVCYDVPVATVDALVYNGFRPPDVLSIDAEGSDFPVLQGASTVLGQYRPAIIFEGGDEGMTKTLACINFLQGLGYGIKEVDLQSGKLVPHYIQPNYQGNVNLVAVWG